MRQYGKKKTKTSVEGHQDCSTCHPDFEHDRKKRARREGKEDIYLDIYLEKDDLDPDQENDT